MNIDNGRFMVREVIEKCKNLDDTFFNVANKNCNVNYDFVFFIYTINLATLQYNVNPDENIFIQIQNICNEYNFKLDDLNRNNYLLHYKIETLISNNELKQKLIDFIYCFSEVFNLLDDLSNNYNSILKNEFIKYI